MIIKMTKKIKIKMKKFFKKKFFYNKLDFD